MLLQPMRNPNSSMLHAFPLIHDNTRGHYGRLRETKGYKILMDTKGD